MRLATKISAFYLRAIILLVVALAAIAILAHRCRKSRPHSSRDRSGASYRGDASWHQERQRFLAVTQGLLKSRWAAGRSV